MQSFVKRCYVSWVESESVMFQNILTLIKRHPVWAYFILTIGLSWGGVFLVSGGLDGFPADQQQVETLLPLVVVSLTIGPALVGILLTALLDGRAGLRDLFARMFRWRVGLRWYGVALLLAPLLAAATLLGLSQVSPVYLPGIVVSDDKATLLLSALMAGLVGGLLEEPGWTGFATPRLRQRYGVFATGLILGLLWGVWHFIVAIWGSGTPSGKFSLSLFLPQLTFYVLALPGYRVLMTWVYARTQSLFVAMVMHASLTGGTLFLFMPIDISGMPLLTWYVVLAAAFWAVVVPVFATKNKNGRLPI